MRSSPTSPRRRLHRHPIHHVMVHTRHVRRSEPEKHRQPGGRPASVQGFQRLRDEVQGSFYADPYPQRSCTVEVVSIAERELAHVHRIATDTRWQCEIGRILSYVLKPAEHAVPREEVKVALNS